MEAVHAAYLDLTGNVSDLRSRLGDWVKGDESSGPIAEERIERLETILGSVVWPTAMQSAIAKTGTVVGTLGKALKEKDRATAEQQSTALGDANHDVIHAFYGDWLPEMKGAQLTGMALHAGYLDLSANISDLQSRVAAWQKGDAGSLNIAKEKAERIGVLLPHVASSGLLRKPMQDLGRDLPVVTAALHKEDVVAAGQALKPVDEASRDLTRGFYLWMDVAAGTDDSVCVQASYLDLSRNISNLRTGVGNWQKGDPAGLNTANESLERIEVVIDHSVWPDAMASAIDRTKSTAGMVAKALGEKDVAASDVAAKKIADSLHDVTHAFYGYWLPGAQLAVAIPGAVNAPEPSKANAPSGAHGHEATASSSAVSHGNETQASTPSSSTVGPNWPIVGGFLGILALVVLVAGVTKPRAAALVSLRSNNNEEPA